MTSARPYSSPIRAQRADANRQRIIDAAQKLFVDDAKDFTLEQVASLAGVTVRTVLRAFGTKQGLIIEAIGTFRASEPQMPSESFPSVAAAVTTLFDDYEEIGDRVVRMLADEHRIAGFADVAAHGRDMHRRWVEAGFAEWLRGYRGRERRTVVTALVAATDVYTWKLLRRDLGLDRHNAESAVAHLVNGALTGPTT